MGKRLFAIAVIWVVTSASWFILAGTVSNRTQSSEGSMRNEVGSTWGSEQRQAAPALAFEKLPRPMLMRSDVNVDIDLAYRQKGLVSYSTYGVVFRGMYTFRGDEAAHNAILTFVFPAERALYDDFTLVVDGHPVPVVTGGIATKVPISVAPHRDIPVIVSYRSRGLGSWRYDLGDHVANIRDFRLRMRTNFAAIDFPANTLSPTTEHRDSHGWNLTWHYNNLITGYAIGLTMPEKMQPGILAQRLTVWAPISLLFFFVLLFVITTLRKIELHPMNYAFLAGAFFAFHLLFAYLVDHISISIAFTICSVVSVFLVISYLRLVAGMRFAALEAGAAQLIYLVLFSFALFFEGWSGLTITAGAIATLFVVMQLTGRIRWNDLFAPPATHVKTQGA